MIRLNLGCGNKPLPNCVNHDRTLFAAHVDIAHDLNILPWPWLDNTFDAIIAHSVVEHLDSFYAFFDEVWRILKPNGLIEVIVPRYDHINVAIDPTHKRGYVMESFQFLDPHTYWGAKAAQYTSRYWHLLRVEEMYSGGVASDIIAQLEACK